MSMLNMIRKSCQNFKPYVSGKSVELVKREYKIRSIIKLASNENALGPSKKAIRSIKANLEKIFAYPDSSSYRLKKALSELYSLSVENIFTGAGGDEIIELVARLFFEPEDEIVISRHSFVRHAMAVKLMGSKAIVVSMKDGFKYDLSALVRACNGNTKAVFVTNPNNPTGTYVTKAELEEFFEKLPINKFGVKPIVILDEAYFEYAVLEKDYPNGLDFLKNNPNLIVFRTFSKAYGLAGLRVAYGFANEQIVDHIERIRPPFNVNLLAQAAAVASITDNDQVEKSQRLVKKEKEYLYKEFEKLKIKYIKSAANFIMFNSSPLQGIELFEKFLKSGIIVRAIDEYELAYWVRVTVGVHKQNKLFIKNLKKYTDEAR